MIKINTKTQEEYDRLMKYLEKNGYMWCSNTTPTSHSNWDVYKNDTIITLREDSKIINDYGTSDDGQTVDEYLNKVDPEAIDHAKAINELYQQMINERRTFGHIQPLIMFDECATWDPFNKLKDKSMEIVKFAKNLTLSKNEKLMRKQGLKDENGIYTDAYTEIVDNIVYSEYEAKVLEIAKQAEEDDKKK